MVVMFAFEVFAGIVVFVAVAICNFMAKKAVIAEINSLAFNEAFTVVLDMFELTVVKTTIVLVVMSRMTITSAVIMVASVPRITTAASRS